MDKDIEWGRINAFHMDEYIGLDKDAPQGFGNFLRVHIFALAPFKSVNYIDCTAKYPYLFCIVPAPTKAQAVRENLAGSIDEHCPASILRRKANANRYLDKDSASLL